MNLTQELNRYTGEDREAAEAILREVMPTLRRIALGALAKEKGSFVFSATELINEVWLRNLHKGRWKVEHRKQFYLIAAKAMRQALVDAARKRLANKRGSGAQVVSLEGTVVADRSTPSPETVAAIGILMEKFDEVDSQSAHIVNLIYFMGLSVTEAAGTTGMTERQVRSRWKKGQDWLKDRI